MMASTVHTIRYVSHDVIHEIMTRHVARLYHNIAPSAKYSIDGITIGVSIITDKELPRARKLLSLHRQSRHIEGIHVSCQLKAV